MTLTNLKKVALILALATIYMVAAKLGLRLAMLAEQVTIIWPPTGIAMAALLLLGQEFWPGILLGAFLANVTTHEPVAVALGIAAGNTLEAVLAVWLLQRFVAVDTRLHRLKDVVGLIVCSAVFGTAVSASIGTLSLCLGGVQPWSAFGALWRIWWLGDAGGALIVAPAILAWAQGPYVRPRLIVIAEILSLAFWLSIISTNIFSPIPLLGMTGHAFLYPVFPFIIWAALRFGQRGTTLLTLFISATAIAASVRGYELFTGGTTEENLMLLDIFMMTVAATGLLLGAAIAERQDAQKRLLDSQEHMRLILDSSLDAVISIDAHGRITEWNMRAEIIFGWSAPEVMGKVMADTLIPANYRERHWRGVNKFLREGVSNILNKRIEMQALTKSGGIIPVELSITAQKNQDYFFTAFIRDLSLERQEGNSRGLLSAIVESSSDAVISEALQGVITSWNAGAARLFGYTADEVVGKHISLIIPPDRLQEEAQIMEQVSSGKRVEHFDTVRVAKGGRPIQVSVAISPVRDTTGKVVGASKIARDISERLEASRKLRDAHRYLNDVLNHIPDPIFMKDRQHRWIGGNKAFWEFMNGPQEKFIGKSDYDFFPKEEADHFWEHDDKVFTSGGVDSSEEFFTDAHGERRILLTKKTAFLNEKNEQFLIGVIRDISHLKKAEEKILEYSRELERSNQELDDFSYIVSHDLKEPLRGLQSFSQFLLEDYSDKLDEDGKNKLHTISNLTKRMSELLDSLLHYSRLGRTQLAINKTDLNEVVRAVIELFAIKLQETAANIEITCDLPTLVCDRIRIAEVFQNLIGNALKYSDQKGNKIEIGCTDKHERAPGEMIFYVRDHGIGIDPQHLEAIFKIFKRLHPRDAYGGGTGSGLTIAKKIINQHGGQIWAESKGPGAGTTFFFTLPQRKKN
ncbi:MAG: PAS domain S-box protein [Proteobacteria bacterium]|nr:PAS domain S-box protein [Pseudomonadota bacterium]